MYFDFDDVRDDTDELEVGEEIFFFLLCFFFVVFEASADKGLSPPIGMSQS